jgi:hypothetical protein
VTTNPIANFPDIELKNINALSFKIILDVIQINYPGPEIKKKRRNTVHTCIKIRRTKIFHEAQTNYKTRNEGYYY